MDTFSSRTHMALFLLLFVVIFVQNNSAQMTVFVEPETIIKELGTTTINCTVENNPAPVDYRWTRDGHPEFVVYEQLLRLELVTIDDRGVYICEVRTQSGPQEVAAAATDVIIHYTPRWDEEYTPKVAGAVGAPVDISCIVRALPSPNVFWWQFQGNNLTSSGDYTITSQGNVSTLRISSVRTGYYGAYLCSAENYMGGRSFSIQLQSPGIPDSPNFCRELNHTAYNATLECTRGFDGGDPASLTYVVRKSTPYTNAKDTASRWVTQGDVDIITVLDLEPNSNYTLMVFQENQYGRSEYNFAVFVNTLDGPPLDNGGLSMETIAIIAGASGGAVLVIIIIIVACVCCKRKPKESSAGASASAIRNDTSSTSKSVKQKKKDVRNYVMENDHQESPYRPEPGRSSPLKEIRNSFRLKRPPRAAGGINNPNYVPDEGSTTPNDRTSRVYLDYTSPREGEVQNQKAYFINLNHAPGESADGAGNVDGGVYENAAYVRDTSVDSRDNALLRRQQSDPMAVAQRQSRDQPGLAGFGALQDLYAPDSAGGPGSPTVKKEVRLNVRAPSFQPEVPWEFSRDRLFIRLKVGEGTFGEVWRAKAEGILGRPGRIAVAVKMLKEHYTPEERRSLIKELEIMKLLQPHPNVIQLLGCCTTSEPLCVIMEYAANGNLQDLLRCQRTAFSVNDLSSDSPEAVRQRDINLQLRDLKRFGLHVASGMEYIASRELLHRDLAARNILVDENMICKVADFGSARDVIQLRQYESKTQRRLPIRWMAPESLMQCVYTVHSDVWSFGILLWEIITLGSSPYPTMSGPEVMEFVQKGCRMNKPKHCSNAMFAIIKDCWNHFPPKRPSFSILRHRLIAILDEPTTDSLYVDQMGDNAYDIVENMPGEKC